jgi:hypothetical protein
MTQHLSETFLRSAQTGAIAKAARRTAEGNLMTSRVITDYDECGGDNSYLESYLESYLVNLAIKNRGNLCNF